RGEFTPEDAEALLDDYRAKLERAFEETKELAEQQRSAGPRIRPIAKAPLEDVETAAPREALEKVQLARVDLPESFHAHKKLSRQIAKREGQFDEGQIDSAFAVAPALGSLLLEGAPAR